MPFIYSQFSDAIREMANSGAIPEEFLNIGSGSLFTLPGTVTLGLQHPIAIAMIGISVPNFWLGLVMIVLFSVHLGWLPTGGYIPFTQDPIGWLRSTTMPAISLALLQIGLLARITRSTSGVMSTVRKVSFSLLFFRSRTRTTLCSKSKSSTRARSNSLRRAPVCAIATKKG